MNVRQKFSESHRPKWNELIKALLLALPNAGVSITFAGVKFATSARDLAMLLEAGLNADRIPVDHQALAGRGTSPAKAEASRNNGRKGGRPKLPKGG